MKPVYDQFVTTPFEKRIVAEIEAMAYDPASHWAAHLPRTPPRALIAIAAAGLVAMTVIVGWQVIGRYVLGSSPSWTEQAAQV